MRLNGEGTDNTPNQNWDIRYEVVGTPPNRRFYIKFYEIPAYGSNCRENPAYNTTGYIMLEEGTNAIEIHILQSDTCLSWDDGLGIVGLHSLNGQYAAVPPGYNNQPISISPPGVAWRFEPPAGCCNILSLQPTIFLTGNRLTTQQILLKWTLSASLPVSIRRFLVTQIRVDGSSEIIATLPYVEEKDVYSYRVPASVSQLSNIYQVLGITSNEDTVNSNLLVLHNSSFLAEPVYAYYDPLREQIVLSANCNCSLFIQIIEPAGRIIYSAQQFSKQGQPILLDASNLLTGIYFIRVIDVSSRYNYTTFVNILK